MVDHDPADRQPDGRWKGTIIQEKTVREIKWVGLYNKNSDKLYALKQLLPQSDYDLRDREIFERRILKHRKLLDGAKEGIMKNNLKISVKSLKNSSSWGSAF